MNGGEKLSWDSAFVFCFFLNSGTYWPPAWYPGYLSWLPILIWFLFPPLSTMIKSNMGRKLIGSHFAVRHGENQSSNSGQEPTGRTWSRGHWQTLIPMTGSFWFLVYSRSSLTRCYCPLWTECSHINPTSQFNGVNFMIETPFQVLYFNKLI